MLGFKESATKSYNGSGSVSSHHLGKWAHTCGKCANHVLSCTIAALASGF